MLNKTHAEHAGFAVAIQLALMAVFGVWAAGAVAVAVFLGREISQHEAKGGGANAVPPLYGLVNHWSADSVLDVVSPAVACILVAGLLEWLL